MPLNRLLAVVLVLASARFAVAEVMVAPTLEWLTDHCVDIGVYRVTKVEKKSDAIESYRMTLTRRQTLRGEPRETVEEAYDQVDLETVVEPPIVKVGDDFLLFFQHRGDGDSIATQRINLSQPQRRGPPFIAVTSDFKLLDERMLILHVVRDRLRRHPKGEPVPYGDRSKDHRVALEPQQEPYAAIYAGSSCYLNMPKDLLPK